MSPAAAIQWVSRRDRAVVGGALAGIVVLAWTYILLGAGVDTAMNMAMGDITMPMPWTLTTFRVMLVMWIVMMTAMMLPSAAPMILLFATINRRRSGTSTPYATGLFALAYLSLWAAFSLAATWAQWGLEHARLLSATMATASTSLAGAVFLLAGVYQLTPLKQACRRRCRSPLEFLSHYWQGGALGAFRMRLRHGLFCLGCCWAMMALLFVGGLMNVRSSPQLCVTPPHGLRNCVPCADSSPSTRPRLEPKAKIPNHEGTRLRFALDSLLEGDGFELPVPGALGEAARARPGEITDPLPRSSLSRTAIRQLLVLASNPKNLNRSPNFANSIRRSPACLGSNAR